ncbi:Elongator subunit elp4 [Recurvomyces mirabilis]|nr:Elongator subunit elp4 [Recurvomyces mirabilis]
MAFRKRNVAVGRGGVTDQSSGSEATILSPGTRPSSLTSQPVTSSGTLSLDDLLGGHGGMPLGSSLFIEESGTTDFAGALLRFYAAEGICQNQYVHVVGVGEAWVRELPGLVEEKSSRAATASKPSDDERMKIAWRYEKLGQAGERALPDRSAPSKPDDPDQTRFCHVFDLTKRLSIPPDTKINYVPVRSLSKPFDGMVKSIHETLKSSPPQSTHRIVVPTILSPAIWPPSASQPTNFLAFLHSLRSLLSQYPTRSSAMMTLPLELHPRSSGLMRWTELLSDGVLELTPFPHLTDATNPASESRTSKDTQEQPQGMLRVHKLPVTTERGEGGAGVGNSLGADLAFTVSRRKFIIKPYSLPPLEGDQDAQKEAGQITGKDVEF